MVIARGSRGPNIIVSGLTAAGKTTHAKNLSVAFGLRYVSASTILLELAGLSTDQPRSFWLSEESKVAIDAVKWDEIDDRMHELEWLGGNVFDTFTLGWHRTQPALAVWLESDLRSRSWKAIVSHGPEETRTDAEIGALISEKDFRVREEQIERGRPDLFVDRRPFAVTLDISALIDQPTEASSRRSVALAQEILTVIVGDYISDGTSGASKALENRGLDCKVGADDKTCVASLTGYVPDSH